jgi:hypothetical protein
MSEQQPKGEQQDEAYQYQTDTIRVPMHIKLPSVYHDYIKAFALLDEKGMTDIVDEAIEYYVNNRPVFAVYEDGETNWSFIVDSPHIIMAKLTVDIDVYGLLFEETSRLNLKEPSYLFEVILRTYLETRLNDPMLPAKVKEAKRKQQEHFTQPQKGEALGDE